MTHDSTAAQEEATRLWDRRLDAKGRKPIPLEWSEPITAADGSPLVSARVDSPFAATALTEFMRADAVVFNPSTWTRQPTFDYDVPGRTACLWRSGGVWVELWHPESALAVPGPPAAPVPAATPKPRGFWRTPSARLPYGRKRTAALTTKEN